jgi:Tfp pilus assembly protein PilO
MSSERQSLITLLCIGAGLVAGGGIIVWPQYREAGRTSDQIAALRARIEDGESEAKRLEIASTQLAGLERRRERELKNVPPIPDMASLILALTRPDDSASVLDQTFTTGRAGPATSDPDNTMMGLPLTVDLRAKFDEVFAQVEAAESMDRLVRVTSLRASRDLENDELVEATLGLEAIFDPAVVPANQEGR